MPKEFAEFVNEPNDSKYFRWLGAHQQHGLVMNRYAKPSENYLNVHKADCSYIQLWRDSASGYTHTTRGYGKVCSDSMDVLKRWAQVNVGLKARSTKRCHCWKQKSN